MAWAWAAWMAVCVVWGTTYLAIRISLETLPPFLMGATRWLVAGAMLAMVVRMRGESWPPVREWPGFAIAGLLLIGFGNGGVVWAEQYVPSGIAAVIVATVPFWMVGLEAMVPAGERVSRGAIMGLLVGFAGILLLVWPEVSAGGTDAVRFGWGIVALQLACAGWALGSVSSKRHAPGASVLATTALQMLAGGTAMLLVGLVAREPLMPVVSARSAGALIYLILAGSIGGYLAYIYALRHLPISTVSLYAYVNPVIAVVLGSLVLSEPLGSRITVATALVLSGSAIVRVASRDRRMAEAGPASGGRARLTRFRQGNSGV